MNPKEININNFDYDLPNHRIAKYPLADRSASKLLVYKNNQVHENKFKNLLSELPKGSSLIFNNTKVVNARLYFQKTTGATIELFCLEPHDSYADLQIALQETHKVYWNCLIGNAKKWKEGKLTAKHILANSSTIELSAEITEKHSDYYTVLFEWNTAATFAEVLEVAGNLPIPPYLNRETEESDKIAYQTVYSAINGSVAAPTAGLHFTDELLNELRENGIQTLETTLHVGAGTFKPVSAEKLADHDMHSEEIVLTRPFLTSLISALNAPLVCVGTTSLRTLETIYWMGVKLLNGAKTIHEVQVQQWDPYESYENSNISPQQAVEAVLNFLPEESLSIKTQIIITPAYSIKMVEAIITNFHQPKSTLLLLIAAFTKNWRNIYDYALSNEFRFLSFGDSSLLFKD